MLHGDHVKVIGLDGIFVFLGEGEGKATLQMSNAVSTDKPTLLVSIDQVLSLEHSYPRGGQYSVTSKISRQENAVKKAFETLAQSARRMVRRFFY